MVLKTSKNQEKLSELVTLAFENRKILNVEKEKIETDLVKQKNSIEIEKMDIKQIMDQLANLKLDVKKQTHVGNVKITEKQFRMFLKLLSPEEKKIDPKYSYTTLKNNLMKLQQQLKEDKFSLEDLMKVDSSLDNYVKENENTVNPAVQSMISIMQEIKEKIILKIYDLMMEKGIYFKDQMAQFITLHENKTVFDSETYRVSIEEMENKCAMIEMIYQRYFKEDLEFTLLYQDIMNKKERILELSPSQK